MLKGKAKTDYQREYMRKRRAVRPIVLDLTKPKLYNPTQHRIGDRVLIYRGKRLVETVIPELDADGNPIYE